VDAFPYVDNPVLYHAVEQAGKRLLLAVEQCCFGHEERSHLPHSQPRHTAVEPGKVLRIARQRDEDKYQRRGR